MPVTYYETAANLVLAFHLVWIAFLVFPPLNDGWRQLRLMAILATVLGQIAFLGCPLVVLEHALRGAAGAADVGARNGSFVVYLVHRATGYDLHPSAVVAALMALLVASWYGVRRAHRHTVTPHRHTAPEKAAHAGTQ